LEVELVAGDSQFESQPLFTVLEERKIGYMPSKKKPETMVKGYTQAAQPTQKGNKNHFTLII